MTCQSIQQLQNAKMNELAKKYLISQYVKIIQNWKTYVHIYIYMHICVCVYAYCTKKYK